MKHLIIFTCSVLFTLQLGACNEGDEGTTPVTEGVPTAELVSATDCKIFQQFAVGPGSSGESAVLYSYDAQTEILSLTHVNAGFNCCPGKLSARLNIENRTITIIEKEQEAACRCNCLYDLEIEVRDLPTGNWRILFIEPYLHADDALLSFYVDLAADPTGEHHVPRNHYPWGI
jgi:hypothetical protein